MIIYLFCQGKGIGWLTITPLSVHLQGLPTTTISPHYDLLCPLRTTTNPYPISLPTVWTETPWEGDGTPFTPPPLAPEMVQPPQSLSSSKTAGSSTAMSHWRQGQDICLFHPRVYLFIYFLNVYLTPITPETKSPWIINGKEWKVGVLQIQHHSCKQQTASATVK